MYKSPIEILIDDIQHQIVKQQDEEIYKAVLNFVPNVDKEELILALRYDRDQYEKGYADGKADAIAEVVRCKDCYYFTEHNDFRTGRHLGYGECHRLRGELFKDNDFCSYGERKDNE